ncbi:uncharacterized protein [Rutidosis leptorrhynchoides]|uniref:uncharacterized protein n=1 Tax=Rutidosis leptorrhynchoides TaxID=125765 RepID=UPI003A998BA0
MTMNMYYSYQIRDRAGTDNLLTRSGRLFQQYIVTAYCSIELQRIDYIRNNQNNIRNEYLCGLHDAINRGDQMGSDVGSRVILPASFTGSPRYMYSHYLDALAICRVHGNPKFFITFTCNSKWPEIRRYLAAFSHLTTADRTDIVTRIFKLKVNKFVNYLKQERPFGRVVAVLYTIEFQKRGTPHCHTLLWTETLTLSLCNIEDYISTELPDPMVDPLGYKVVSEFMIHGPCGAINISAQCMDRFVCTKKFPKSLNMNTYFDKNGYAQYRRRNTGVTAKKCGVDLDNSYVVPYNRNLCLIFHAHINVEYCGWTMMIKYLFKYISKGTDKIVMRVSRDIGQRQAETENQPKRVDEIQNFVDDRFICPCEACWRMYGFSIHHREPAKNTLIEWLEYNRRYSEGHHLTYLDFPKEFVWLDKDRCWARRRNLNKPLVGRLTYMHPTTGEVFYLRMLLCHQRGCKTFEEIRVVGGTQHSNYRSACEALGLLGNDREWTAALQEASASATSAQLRSLFVHMLMFCEVTSPLRLWNENWELMADDIPLRAAASLHIDNLHVNDTELRQYVLCEIEVILSSYNKSITDFGLPPLSENLLRELNNRLIMEERNYNRQALRTEFEGLIWKMNEKQKYIYDLIVNASVQKKQELIFVYGFGGTGKTFLWRCIITYLRSEGKIVLAVASSGIASLLLPAGRTAHSRFKLPIDLIDETETELIVWDEAPMNDKKCFESLDRTLRDILDCDSLPFGGKSIILGGDFRQTMPVKKRV